MKQWKRASFFIFFILASCVLHNKSCAATFLGEAPTGFMELDNFRYPVFLFVPQNYKPSQSYPLIIALPDEKDSSEAFAKEWTPLAKNKGYIILVPAMEVRSDDVPYRTDGWLLKLKKEIMSRYKIAPERVYLIGKSSSAHYAAYLGINYPREFSAVGLVGGSWTGPFEKLLRLSSRPRKQSPFFVAIPEDNPRLLKATEAKAYQLTKKGYPVYLEKISDSKGTLTNDFRNHMLQWLEKKGQSWLGVIQESERSWKEKFFIGVEEFFIPK